MAVLGALVSGRSAAAGASIATDHGHLPSPAGRLRAHPRRRRGTHVRAGHAARPGHRRGRARGAAGTPDGLLRSPGRRDRPRGGGGALLRRLGGLRVVRCSRRRIRHAGVGLGVWSRELHVGPLPRPCLTHRPPQVIGTVMPAASTIVPIRRALSSTLRDALDLYHTRAQVSAGLHGATRSKASYRCPWLCAGAQRPHDAPGGAWPLPAAGESYQ